MKAIAAAHHSRSLMEFNKCLKEYEAELSGDPIVHLHISALYDTLLEQNLLRLIEPFSEVVSRTISFYPPPPSHPPSSPLKTNI